VKLVESPELQPYLPKTISIHSQAELQSLFSDALEYLEDHKDLKDKSRLSLGPIMELLLERNLESLPFYNYVKVKFNNNYSH
jgi:uncharacterized protein YejL (UPF0352 family)